MTPSNKERQEKLRHLAAQPPSALVWQRICQLLEEAPEEEIDALLQAGLKEALEPWDSALKVPPLLWSPLTRPKEAKLCAALTRSLSLVGLDQPLFAWVQNPGGWLYPSSIEWEAPPSASSDIVDLLLQEQIIGMAKRLSLKNVRLTYAQLERLCRAELPALRSLTLSNCGLTEQSMMALYPGLPRHLQALDISYNRFTKEWPRAVQDLFSRYPPRLKSLSLAGCTPPALFDLFSALAEDNVLEKLDLSACEIEDQTLRDLITHLETIEERRLASLSLRKNRLTQRGLLDLSRTAFAAQLRELFLGENQLDEDLSSIAAFRNLSSLDLGYNLCPKAGPSLAQLRALEPKNPPPQPTPEGVPFWLIQEPQSSNKTSSGKLLCAEKLLGQLAKSGLPLARLGLAGFYLTDELLSLTGPLLGQAFSSLQELDLSRNELTAQGVCLVLEQLPNLQSLRLSGCSHLWEEPAEPGSDLCRMFSSLTKLSIAKTQMDTGTLEALLGCLPPERLVSLDLSQNALGREGIEVLQRAPLGPLQSLSLAAFGIDDDALLVLGEDQRLSQLTSLDLSGNQISIEGICRFLSSSTTAHLQALYLSPDLATQEALSELCSAAGLFCRSLRIFWRELSSW